LAIFLLPASAQNLADDKLVVQAFELLGVRDEFKHRPPYLGLMALSLSACFPGSLVGLRRPLAFFAAADIFSDNPPAYPPTAIVVPAITMIFPRQLRVLIECSQGS